MKTLYIEKNATEIIIAYPSDFGHDTEDQLYDWEAADRSNRELFICKTKAEAKELFNYYKTTL
jgi:hypothetical protein